MDWRAMWSITMGVEPQAPYVPPYVASLVFFFINMVVGVGLRAMSRLLLPSNVRGHVLDFLCTMEACAYFFENNFVVKHYGYTWLAVAIIGQLYVCSRTFGDNLDNPVKAFHGWLVGEAGGRTEGQGGGENVDGDGVRVLESKLVSWCFNPVIHRGLL